MLMTQNLAKEFAYPHEYVCAIANIFTNLHSYKMGKINGA